VLLPLAAIVVRSTKGGWETFWNAITDPQAVAALRITLLASLAVVLAYMSAFAVLLTGREQLGSLLAVAAAAGTATAAVEVVSYLAHPDARGGVGVGDPNFVAAYLLVSLPLVLVLAGLVAVLFQSDAGDPAPPDPPRQPVVAREARKVRKKR